MTYFLHDAPLASGRGVTLQGEEARHLLTVRRIRVGERFALQDPAGRRFSAELISARRGAAEVAVQEALPVPPPPPVHLTLLQAAVKEKAAEAIIEKATELGAAAVTVFPAAHSSVAHKALAAPKALARWERIAWEACKQCDRQFPPALSVQSSLAAALQAHPAVGASGGNSGNGGWLLDPDGEQAAAALLPGLSPGPLAILIGPEGGWTQAELQAALAAGYRPVRLGGTILRAETAAAAACALALLGAPG